MARKGFFQRVREFFRPAETTANDIIPQPQTEIVKLPEPVRSSWAQAVDYSDTNTAEVEFGRIPTGLHDAYTLLVSGTVDYFSLDRGDRQDLAEEFVDRFVLGGYSRTEMRHWMQDQGMDAFDDSWWDTYRDAYIESV